MTPRAATIFQLREDDEALVESLAPRRFVRVTEDAERSLSDDALERGPATASLVWREALSRRLLGVADMIATALALLVVLSAFHQADVLLAVPAGVGLVLMLFKVSGLYDRDDLRLVHSTLDEAPTLLQVTGLFALGVATAEAILPAATLTAGQIAALWLLSFVSIFAARVTARAVAGRTAPAERCLVIGDPKRTDHVREKLAASRARASVVAALPMGHEIADDDWSGMPEILRRVVKHLNVHRIIIAPTATDTGAVVNLIRTAKAVGVRVSVLPRMLEVVGSAVEFDDVDGMTMLGIRRFGLSRSSRLLKRGFDFALAAVGMVFIGPVIAAIAVVIKLESPGPVFFRQVRVGRDGKHFRIFKFRSMVVDAEAQKDSLRSLNEVGDGMFKLTADPRVTRVGQLPAPDLARRAAAAVQRAARRDEPRRPAPAGHRRGRAGPRPGPQPPAPHPGHDRPVAGARRPASRCTRWSGSTTSTSPTGRSGSTSRCCCAPPATSSTARTSSPCTTGRPGWSPRRADRCHGPAGPRVGRAAGPSTHRPAGPTAAPPRPRRATAPRRPTAPPNGPPPAPRPQLPKPRGRAHRASQPRSTTGADVPLTGAPHRCGPQSPVRRLRSARSRPGRRRCPRALPASEAA